MLHIFQNLFASPRDLILPVVSVWVGLIFTEKRADRYGITPATIGNLVLNLLLAYIVGGRSFFLMEHIPAFEQNPISLVSLNTSLFDNQGGLAAAIIAGLVFGQRAGLSLVGMLDALTLIFSWLVLGLSLSHLATGSAFGRETNFPWGIYLWGAMRYPTQYYEIAASILIIFLIWTRKPSSKIGSDFFLFIILLSISRMIIEGFRGDSILVLGGLRLAQILAWFALAISLFCLELLKPKDAELSPAHNETGVDTHLSQLYIENNPGNDQRIKRTPRPKTKSAKHK
jgi:phosphatidylglycerol:prolipoprotein diacylglycerol transferase